MSAIGGSSIDLERLLAAIRAVETPGGEWPRLEAGYMPAGLHASIQGRVIVGTGRCWNDLVSRRWEAWRPQSLYTAASWGPWQILYHTAADVGYMGPPWDLCDPGVCEVYVIARLRQIERRFATRTVRDFADAWNSGNPRDDVLVTEYTDKVNLAYLAIQ
jgi:hypothetical protein